jgi:hypothetical protein
MDLPSEDLLNSIRDFCVIYFKDSKHQKDAPPHFYVTFPVRDALSLIICIITSQVATQKEYYRRTNAKAEKCLIQVSNDVFSFLDRKKNSVIDCNQAELLSKEELRKRIDSQTPFEIKERKIPSFLKKEVGSAIIRSPLIPKSIKNLIKGKK